MSKHIFNVNCACGANEHHMTFTYYDGDNEVYVQYFLQSQPFWKRLILGIKYIFGYKCRYGHFGETVLDRQAAGAIIQSLELLTKERQNESK